MKLKKNCVFKVKFKIPQPGVGSMLSIVEFVDKYDPLEKNNNSSSL